MERGLVAGYVPCGLVDGPGSRFVLFLQGCNMMCFTCHNYYTRGTCVNCGSCVKVCPTGALGMVEGKRVYRRDKCIECDACLDACPHSANPRAMAMDVQEVIDLIAPYSSYLSGVTLSGGEATCQWRFAEAVARECGQQLNLPVLLDSNGKAEASVWDSLLPVLEGVLLDIKAVEPDLHRRLTGCDNSLVLESLEKIHGVGKLVEVRHLLIPGFTTDQEHFAQLCRLVAGLSPQPTLRLQAYSNRRVTGKAKEVPSLSKDELAKFVQLAGELAVTRVLINS